MFSEILRIRPVLDRGATANMERQLNGRFARVSNRFKRGLIGALKGSIVGISIGLLSRLMEPLKALEERVKALLDQGEELSDTAERLGTTPGRVKQLEIAGQALGLTPERLQTMLTEYANAVDAAKEEFEKREKDRDFAAENPLSDRGQILAQFLTPDKLKSFVDFLASLRNLDMDKRARVEREIFGERQVGGERRLIQSNLERLSGYINTPDSKTLDSAAEHLKLMKSDQDMYGAMREAETFVSASKSITPEMNAGLSEVALTKTKQEIEENKNFAALKQMNDGLSNINKILTDLAFVAGTLAAHLGDIAHFLKLPEVMGFLRKFGAWTLNGGRK